MRVFSLDPSFHDLSGHHFAVNELISTECRRRGIPCTVLAHADSRLEIPGMDIRRVFSTSLYGEPPDHELAPMFKAVQLNLSFEEELKAYLPESEIKPGDVFVAHTISYAYLIGLFRWYRCLKVPNVSLRIVLRFPPHHQAGEFFSIVEPIYAYALSLYNTLPEDKDARFFTDWNILSKYYEDLSGLKVGTIPISIDFADFPEQKPITDLDQRPIRFGYLGVARQEKGFDLLPEAIRSYQAERAARGLEPDKFIIQTPGAGTEVLAELHSLSGVQTLDNCVFGADFHRMLEICDVVFIPYDPESYYLRSSHILIEALGMARPVITTRDTWMEDELRTHLGFPVGTFMERFDSESLADAMLAFADNAQAYASNAAFASHLVRLKHNSIVFMDALLATPWAMSISGTTRAAS